MSDPIRHEASDQDAEKGHAGQIEPKLGATAVVDAALERRVVRKLDHRIVPLVSFLFLLSFLDRSNIGNARIAGMEEDLGLRGDQYEWLLTIFYIPYILFEFLIIMWKVLPPHAWACFIVFAWGVVATCQAAVTSWGGLMALRFLLGASEAGFGPGIPYLLSFFYLRHELGFRSGLFLAAAPLATCFSGALAYGITSGHPGLANWRLLFLVEGVPTILMAPVAYFCLPDTPQHARFLTGPEKQAATARGVKQVGDSPAARVGGIHWPDVLATLRDPKPWLTAFMYFSCNVSYASLPVFVPTILNQMGFGGVTAQGLSAPPFFLSACLTVLTTWVADRTRQRGLMIIALSLMAGVGYVMLATCKSVAARYAGVFLAAAGVFPAIGNILPWVMNNQGSDSRRGAGMVMLNAVGQCGPLLGTNIFPARERPYYVKGQSVCAAFMFFTALLALALRLLLMRENRRLDRRYGTLEEQRARGGAVTAGAKSSEEEGVVEEGEGGGAAAVENYGPMFRYIL
ncbi:pantothenate transporter liz1 [Apiospora marii]|uniref:pantothenate transporter liz1 n=1 Tax=Apiospora marii TaxID=335849 RepID=UPI00312D6267